MGKRRRVENADLEQEDGAEEDAHKRRKREAELQRQVEEYTVRTGAGFVQETCAGGQIDGC